MIITCISILILFHSCQTSHHARRCDMSTSVRLEVPFPTLSKMIAGKHYECVIQYTGKLSSMIHRIWLQRYNNWCWFHWLKHYRPQYCNVNLCTLFEFLICRGKHFHSNFMRNNFLQLRIRNILNIVNRITIE